VPADRAENVLWGIVDGVRDANVLADSFGLDGEFRRMAALTYASSNATYALISGRRRGRAFEPGDGDAGDTAPGR
jgi:hypothetical protein